MEKMLNSPPKDPWVLLAMDLQPHLLRPRAFYSTFSFKLQITNFHSLKLCDLDTGFKTINMIANKAETKSLDFMH